MRGRPAKRLAGVAAVTFLVTVGTGGLGLAGAQDAAAPSSYVPTAPARVVDTRTGLGGGALAGNGERLVVPVAVPAGATAVEVNLTVVDASGPGYLTAWAAGEAPSGPVSVLNWDDGAAVANAVSLPLGSGGGFVVRASTGAELVVDQLGYYVPAGAGPAGPAGPPGADGAPGPAGPPGPADPGVAAFVERFGDDGRPQDGRGFDCVLGTVWLTAGSIAQGTVADGRILTITQDPALFSLMGTTFGGDGLTTFALPNLSAAAPDGLTYAICTDGVFPSPV